VYLFLYLNILLFFSFGVEAFSLQTVLFMSLFPSAFTLIALVFPLLLVVIVLDHLREGFDKSRTIANLGYLFGAQVVLSAIVVILWTLNII